MFRRIHLRLISSIAILAVLLNALVPVVSQALASTRQGGWIEVCSSQGFVRLWQAAADATVAASDSSSSDEAPQGLHGSACLYCVTHAGSFGLVTGVAFAGVPALPRSSTLLVVDAVSIHPAAVWLIPAVRAPPLSFIA